MNKPAYIHPDGDRRTISELRQDTLAGDGNYSVMRHSRPDGSTLELVVYAFGDAAEALEETLVELFGTEYPS